MTISPGARFGAFDVLSVIGAGGMGEVYRAHDRVLGRDVAIKVLPALWLADPDRRARFEREARVLASLNHPHIAAIYGIEDVGPSSGPGQAAGRALILELVEGETLADLIGRPAFDRAAWAPSQAQSGNSTTQSLRVDKALRRSMRRTKKGSSIAT
jgi:eukaryotic-like serine/threonine-protein kinase